jgi:hypothetical protein
MMMLAGTNQSLKACQSRWDSQEKALFKNLICAHARNAAAIALDNLIYKMARKANRLSG